MVVRMAGTETSTARAGREIDHEADGKDVSSGSSSFIDSGINHFENGMIPVLYDKLIEPRYKALAFSAGPIANCFSTCLRKGLKAGFRLSAFHARNSSPNTGSMFIVLITVPLNCRARALSGTSATP